MPATKLVPLGLAGGAGTRLRPLSRGKMPKQFIVLGGDRSTGPETPVLAVPTDHVVADTNTFFAAGLKLCAAYRRQHGADDVSLMPTRCLTRPSS